ncbi:MAG TPA: hypothetical protein VFD60_09095 [Nitrososphaeraceae archaeon]|jgi:hypothetical protein|nr:hypothetical protein [Nitrososphaeraceae archaeon]
MSEISENKSPAKITRVKTVVAMTIAIGIALMTTLAAVPNAI